MSNKIGDDDSIYLTPLHKLHITLMMQEVYEYYLMTSRIMNSMSSMMHTTEQSDKIETILYTTTGGSKKTMRLVEEITLPNKLVVEIWDNSRPISDDTIQVRLVIKIKVDMKEEYFSEPVHSEQVKKVFGPEIYYEYQKDRTFVNKSEKDTVFSEFLNDFKRDMLPYLERPQFPSRFAVSKYKEIQKRFYKYQHLLNKSK